MWRISGCEATVKVPAVKLKLELVHAYCALLAVRGLKELLAPSSLNPEAKVTRANRLASTNGAD